MEGGHNASGAKIIVYITHFVLVCLILTWRGTKTWSSKPLINTGGVLSMSMPLHAGLVTGNGYDFGCTPGAEFLIAWGCALAPTPHPNK